MEHAHELPEFLHFLEEFIEEYGILRGFIFGFIHTLIPLIGFYSGWSINRFLKLVSMAGIGRDGPLATALHHSACAGGCRGQTRHPAARQPHRKRRQRGTAGGQLSSHA